jgi:hypothetical protein
MESMSDEKITINRTMVGLLALVCLGASLTIWLMGPTEQFWRAAFMRVGLLMLAFWLALPTRSRDAAWANVSPKILIGMALAIVVVAIRPNAVKVAVPILIVLAIVGFVLRPPDKQRPKTRPSGSS